ncbi:MAG: AgmX/PglI C-terminal domain-containing protein, partial [Kofleriaceae bacterium]
YGTLGHGSGTGDGYGVGRGGMRGRQAAPPTVRTNVTEVSGDLDKAIVRRHLRRYQARVSYCYQKQLAIEPGLAGTVTAHFDVDAQGQVTSSTASGLNDEVASCVAATIRRSAFPRPTSGTVSVTASFTMSPPPAPAP